MKTTAFTVAVLAISGVLISAPASAACQDEIAELEDAISSALTVASNDARQAATVEKDAAADLCGNGDEFGAAERVAARPTGAGRS